MRKLIVFLALIAVVGGVAYLVLFRWDDMMALFGQAKHQAEQVKNEVEGYGPAKTPSEAMDRFLKAIKERNYDAAQLYLVKGDYSEEFHKGAENGQALGKALDALRHDLNLTKVSSDKADQILWVLDPFPTDFKVKDVKNEGDTKAYALIAEETSPPGADIRDWQIPAEIGRSLFCFTFPAKWELVKEGEGDKAAWKINMPVVPCVPTIHEKVDYLAKKGGNYAQAINKVKADLKTDAATKNNIEDSLKTELTGAK